MATSAHGTKMSLSIKQIAIALLTTLVLVLGVSVPAAVATNGSADNTVSATLELKNAFVKTADGQPYTAPSGEQLKLPVGSDFKFQVVPNKNCEIKSVTATIGGNKEAVSKDANGFYVVPGSKVKANFKITVEAESVVTKAAPASEKKDTETLEAAKDTSTANAKKNGATTNNKGNANKGEPEGDAPEGDVDEEIINKDTVIESEDGDVETLTMTEETTVEEINEVVVPVNGLNRLDVDENGKATLGEPQAALYYQTKSKCETGWIEVIVKPNEKGQLVVNSVIPSGTAKSDQKLDDGFVLVINGVANANAIRVGEYAVVSFDYKTPVQKWNDVSLGTVTFTTIEPAEEAPAVQPSDRPTRTASASTNNFIEVNLYDYGAKINDKWKADSKYPGFQNPGGTSISDWTGNSVGLYRFNYGDNITSEPFLTTGNANVTNAGGLINATTNGANSPISGAIKSELSSTGKGYPVLEENGAELNYLFSTSASDSVTKINGNKSIDGLFKYNPLTGEYSFNSRENHAEYNGSTNSFDLYNQLITSNYMMYPFGNFLPFNKINDATQASKINATYFDNMIASANTHNSADYKRLADTLTRFQSLIYTQTNTTKATANAATYVNEYFKKADIPKRFTTGELSNIYNIDYDTPTDFFFGMDMSMTFMQPHNGLTGPDGRQQMIYKFSGDDDVLVYIDGKLFLDLSGIHRHVGGEIDFVKGEVRYYSLIKEDGDVAGAPYKTVKFSDIVGAGKVNSKGTFEDYTTHTFRFFYMERGSGSGVCRMNFNFPVIKENSILIHKEVTGEDAEALGNPDFTYQVFNTANELVSQNKVYYIQDDFGNYLKRNDDGTFSIASDQNNPPSYPTGESGYITIKRNQSATITGIAENEGSFYAKEIMYSAVGPQYNVNEVSGQTINGQNVGNNFTGYQSKSANIADGNIAFRYVNNVSGNYGQLKINKQVMSDAQADLNKDFSFDVTINKEKVKVGTKYVVTDQNGNTEERTVSTAGVITIKPNQTATISKILAGSTYTVKEQEVAGYGATYEYGYVKQTEAGYEDYEANTEGLGDTPSATEIVGAAGVIVASEQQGANNVASLVKVANGPIMNVPVEKKWDKQGYAQADTFIKPIKVRLYKVVGDDNAKNGAEPELVVDNNGNAREITLSETNSWKDSFKDLPRYELVTTGEGDDATSSWEPIHYTVKEVDGDGNPVGKLVGFYAPVYDPIPQTDDGVPMQNYLRMITNTFDKGYLGKLKITKELQSGADEDFEAVFTFNVAIGGAPIAANTEYTLVKKDGTETTEKVTTAGIITIKGGETAVISDLLPGTKYEVTEANAPAGFEQVGDIEASYVKGDGNEAIQLADATAGEIVAGEQVINDQAVRDVATLLKATNRAVVNVPVQKEWNLQGYDAIDGIKWPVEVKLLKDAGSGAEDAGIDPLVLNEDNNWEATFESLPKYEEVDGAWVEINYSVKEILVNEGEEVANMPAFQEPAYTLDDGVWKVANTFNPSFILRKALTNPNETLQGTTFVYRVTAVKNTAMVNDEAAEEGAGGETIVYDKIFTIEGTGQVQILDIPGDADVITIEEVYTGASYQPVAGTTSKYVLTRQANGTFEGYFVDANGNPVSEQAADAAVGTLDESSNTYVIGGVTFENDYNGERKYGTSVTNEYTKSGSGWTIEQLFSNKND